MKDVFYDIETFGFTGPIQCLQWAEEDADPQMVEFWFTPAQDLMDIFKYLTENRVIAHNLNFDWWHTVKWYNRIHTYLELGGKRSAPIDPHLMHPIDCANSIPYYLKPRGCYDTLIALSKGEFQHLMPQKAIIFRKVPDAYVDEFIRAVEKAWAKPTMFKHHWIRVEEKDKEGFTDLKLVSKSTRKLKHIYAAISGTELSFEASDLFTKYTFSEDWKPFGGLWISATYGRMNDEQKHYALGDVTKLRAVYNHVKHVEEDFDHRRTISTANNYIKGFDVDTAWCHERLKRDAPLYALPTAPGRVVSALRESCSPLQRLLLKQSTNAATLQKLADAGVEKAGHILKARSAKNHKKVMERLIDAKRLYANSKSTGTLTNRASGGSERAGVLRRGGSINLQGIPRPLRSLFTLGATLSGGDFSGFEVSILAAVINDPELQSQLVSGKKFHGMFASLMFGVPYERIIADHNAGKVDASGKTMYDRAKNSVFADIYGAMDAKIATTLALPEILVGERRSIWHAKYRGIPQFGREIDSAHTFVESGFGQGDPADYVETILGFRRYFRFENSIGTALWSLMDHDWGDRGDIFVRRDKEQSIKWCMRSILYSALYTIQGRVRRMAGNCRIQSVGAELCKQLEDRINELQPVGIHPFRVQTINVHDEVQVVSANAEVRTAVTRIVRRFIEIKRATIPLLTIAWKEALNSWGDK